MIFKDRKKQYLFNIIKKKVINIIRITIIKNKKYNSEENYKISGINQTIYN